MEINNATILRRILVRIQGASRGAYRDMQLLMQRRVYFHGHQRLTAKGLKTSPCEGTIDKHHAYLTFPIPVNPDPSAANATSCAKTLRKNNLPFWHLGFRPSSIAAHSQNSRLFPYSIGSAKSNPNPNANSARLFSCASPKKGSIAAESVCETQLLNKS